MALPEWHSPAKVVVGPSDRLPWPLGGLARRAWDEASLLARRYRHVTPASWARDMAAFVESAQRPRLGVFRSMSGPLRLHMATNDPLILQSFARAFGGGQVERVGWVRRRDLGTNDASDADLVALEISLADASRFAQAGFSILPRWVAMEVDLCEPEQVLWDTRKRETVRRIEKSNLELEVQQTREAATIFHEEMYAPLARERHGDRAIIVRPAYIHAAVRSGWVLFVKSAATREAALLVVPRPGRPRALDILLFGVRGGQYDDTELPREAAYLLALRWARDIQRARHVGMTGAAPFVRDGILRFKRRWGAKAMADLRQPTCIAVRLQRCSPEAFALLAAEPLIALRRSPNGATLSTVVPQLRGEPKCEVPETPGVHLERLDLDDPSELPDALSEWAASAWARA